MSCVLRAAGSEFDVDGFLVGSKIAPCAVFHKNGPRSTSQLEGKVHQESGFNADVSMAECNDLPTQVEDAVSFLQDNASDIKRLVRYVGVEGVELDFAIEQRDALVQSDSFPPNLLLLCGQLGIVLTVSWYVQAAD